MTVDEILNSGELHKIMELAEKQEHYYEYLQKMEEYNAAGYTKEGLEKKERILHEVFASVGEGTYIQAPYYAMWGGHHTYLGKNVWINYNATFIEDAEIHIGDGTLIGPNVTISAGSHPISPRLRTEGYSFNHPIYIGKNVWIGSCVTILGGVHIGDNSVIAAGSLVTKDIPANVIAMGSPAKVYREITEDDDKYYDHGKLIKEHMID